MCGTPVTHAHLEQSTTGNTVRATTEACNRSEQCNHILAEDNGVAVLGTPLVLVPVIGALGVRCTYDD